LNPSALIDRIERLPLPLIRRHGLSVRWFDTWSPVLDSALATLPESQECPHEMLVALMRNPSRARKCAALVVRGDRPVAIIALRKTGALRWDVIGGGGVAPRFLAHALDGQLFAALSALGVSVHIATQTQQPPARWVRRVVAHPVFRIDLTSDFEAYWKESGQLRTVQMARKRARGLVFELDGPGAAEWTIRGWADHWRGRQTVSEDDLVLASTHYETRGRFHTIRLLDGREPVAGHTWFVDAGGLLLISTFTRPEYRKQQAGTRNLDAAFDWAAKAGYGHMDLGVGHDYKRRWAPAKGVRWSYDIRPWYLHASAAVLRRGMGVGRRTIGAAREALGVRRSAPSADEL
jgi:GNAT superfamily N-acetyltransferase